MKIGTKSVLFGIHGFWHHGFFVAWAWSKLYGFPWDPRLWVAFFVHDLGYLGKPNMDGPEGEQHPRLGAQIMEWLLDERYAICQVCFSFPRKNGEWPVCPECKTKRTRWHDFTLYHSRYLAKKEGGQPSRLCFADKLVPCLMPWWFYLPLATLSGEIVEYLKNAEKSDSKNWNPITGKPTWKLKRIWYAQLQSYMRKWVDTHMDGRADTWVDANRNDDALKEE